MKSVSLARITSHHGVYGGALTQGLLLGVDWDLSLTTLISSSVSKIWAMKA